MTSPLIPWFLTLLLLAACVALLILLLRYRDRSVRLEAESRSWQERAEDRTQMLHRAEEVLKDSFAGISAEVLRNSEKQFLNLAETRLQSQRQQANHDLESRKQAIESMLKPVSESLKLVQSRLGEMEKERVGAYTDLKTQIRYILSGNEALKNETASADDFIESLASLIKRLKNETARLSQALHHNSSRGQWGELQLRRVVELAGMVEYCDFTTQETRSREEDRVRPDMVIHLPGGRSIIIDAKAPMSSYLNAGQTDRLEERSQWMSRHAADVKRHLQQLSAKNYFAQFSPCPEFVIMFLPGEAFFQAALEADPSLIEFGAENKVILSTPSTLIALLKAVAYGWKQEQLADNAKKISEAGADLFNTCSILTGHFSSLGKSLNQAVTQYNKTVSSFEHRFIPRAQKLKNLGVTSTKDLPGSLEDITVQAKSADIPDIPS